jgi:hypothetical protein
MLLNTSFSENELVDSSQPEPGMSVLNKLFVVETLATCMCEFIAK